MTYVELELRILEFAITKEGKDKLNKRRDKMIQMSKAVEKLLQHNGRHPHNRPSIAGVTFTVNQGVTIAGAQKESIILNVEVGPQKKGVGKITMKSGAVAVFQPKESDKKWIWSGNAKDAREICKFLKDKIQQQDGKNAQERHIQWQMFSALDAKDKKDKEGLNSLRKLRPVAIAGYPSEIPTWINADQEIATKAGNIDALIRGTNGRIGAKFLVFELKAPDGDSPDKAIRQALIYAIALSLEANGDSERQGYYRALFECKEKAELRFGAVAVVHDTPMNRQMANDALSSMTPRPSAEGKKPIVDSLGVLLYDWDEDAKRAHNWQWLEGTDPR